MQPTAAMRFMAFVVLLGVSVLTLGQSRRLGFSVLGFRVTQGPK